MSTKQARTRATAAWRARTGAKLVQAYLHTDIIEKLDRLVLDRGATGRAAVLADLIEQATSQRQEPDTKPAPETETQGTGNQDHEPVFWAPPPPKPPKRWKLTRSSYSGWKWDVVVDGTVIGRMNKPERTGGQWSGELARSPGAENYRYRRTRGELAELLAVLVIDG